MFQWNKIFAHPTHEANEAKIVQSLIENPGLLSHFSKVNPKELLYLAVKQKKSTLLKNLLPQMNLSLLNQSNHYGETVLHLAAKELAIEVLYCLAEYKSFLDPNKKDAKSFSAIRNLFEERDFASVERLADIAVCFQKLIELGVEALDEMPLIIETTIHYMDRYSDNLNWEIFYPLHFLLSYQAEHDFIDSNNQQTLLHIACQKAKQAETILTLLKMGLSQYIDHRDKEGKLAKYYWEKRYDRNDIQVIEALTSLKFKLVHAISENKVKYLKKILEEEGHEKCLPFLNQMTFK